MTIQYFVGSLSRQNKLRQVWPVIEVPKELSAKVLRALEIDSGDVGMMKLRDLKARAVWFLRTAMVRSTESDSEVLKIVHQFSRAASNRKANIFFYGEEVKKAA